MYYTHNGSIDTFLHRRMGYIYLVPENVNGHTQ